MLITFIFVTGQAVSILELGLLPCLVTCGWIEGLSALLLSDKEFQSLITVVINIYVPIVKIGH